MSDEQPQAVPAVGFLVMAFTDENAADEALKALQEAKKQNQMYFEDAAVIRQDAAGKVKYHETGDMSTGKGAGVGALVGGVLGILGGPAGIALGASAGAAIGAIAAHGDAGFKDSSLSTIGVALKPSTSALAMITSHDFLKAVQQQVGDEQLAVFVSNLAAEISRLLEAGKSMALGLVLAEDGLAMQEIAVDDQSAEVVGAVITSDAVVAGAAVITDEGAAYEVGVVTAEGSAVEAGVITDEGAVVVDDVVTDEGEVIVASATVPVTVTAAAVEPAAEVEAAPAEDEAEPEADDEGTDAPAEAEG
ncbi:MAG: DUF1269 domain-containing protein [Caldilineales bacterium]|nr:DUF1269 domain-containing protein [Caldilineales bacterium]